MPSETTPFALIVADIHLKTNPDHPINQAFNHFLEHWAPQAETLYILGDLFERWLGDDIGLEEYAPAIAKLRALTEQGTEIKLLYGNRDFLMREAFWDATGIQPLPEVVLTTLYGHNVIMCHGDELCTLDTAYQSARKKLRNRFIQWLLLKMPAEQRRKVGEKLRQKSQSENQHKDPKLMDVEDATVLAWFEAYRDYPHLIHGHTHKPGKHRYPNGRTRWVLGDWQADGTQLIKIDANQIRLLSFNPASQMH